MSQGDLNQLEVQEKIKRWQRFEGDTGSAEVVVGILTARIAQHARHMQQHHKDFQVKRRLIILLSQRNKMLKFLRRSNRQTYERVLEVEGIRPTGNFDPQYRKRPTKRPTRRGLVEARKRAQKRAVKLARFEKAKRKKKAR
jgi:small subunit ribosomal protein S15